MELYSCVYKTSWTGVLIFFSTIRKKADPNSIIQSRWRLGAFENNANYLDAWLWIEKFKSQLKWSVNLIPVKLKWLVFAIQHRLLVVSQALVFSIFIGTTPLSAEMLQLSLNTSGSTLRVAAKHWNPKTSSWINESHSSLEKFSTVPAEALPAKSFQ